MAGAFFFPPLRLLPDEELPALPVPVPLAVSLPTFNPDDVVFEEIAEVVVPL